MKDVKFNIDRTDGKIDENVERKLHNVLTRPWVYVTLCKLRDVLNDECIFNSSDLILFKYAPAT